MADLPLLIPDWPAPPTVRAAMTTRIGGVSEGPYASLNLGERAGDSPASVAENRRRVRQALGFEPEPVWLKQVHGTKVLQFGSNPSSGRVKEDSEADASFTTSSGVICAVQTADCLPVLFCDDPGTVVAAAHAGWRGLAAGVLEATVHALPVKPGALMAWLGAAIGPESFEVGPEVRQAFLSRDPKAAAHFNRNDPLSPGPGGEGKGEGPVKYYADLYGLARQRLAAAGVSRVYGGGLCTLREAERFFSYRRDGRCGRMAALVWLE